MLTEERFRRILSELEEKGSVTVQELMEQLDASESTIRRDLNTLAARGSLKKVHGGEVAKSGNQAARDAQVDLRKQLNRQEKRSIARYAAGLIEDDDFVYVDAGTTTELLIDFLENREAVYVTNAVSHAKQLAAKGCRVYLLGGEFKGTTEAIVGEEAVASVEKYHFTKGFFGVNGITVEQGFTTPEVREAMIKRKAMEHTGERYILADPSKFDAVSAVTFGSFGDAVILTTAEVPKPYKRQKNVREVEEI